MSIAEALARQAADFALPGTFHAIGAPALLVTNESTPAGFYDAIRSSSRLDGYVFGPGCGNVLAMVEAFPGDLLGMVLVDVDPAVVCAGRMLVACMARQATVEGFVGELFCGGEAALRDLERAVLENEPAASLRRQMEGQRGRLWKALSDLTAGFARAPADVAALLARWAAHLPPGGGVVPVHALLASNYGRLQPLARQGAIAVLCCSIFDPRLLAAVAALPRFGATRHLVYLSNVADHVLRRALLAQAQSRLGLQPEDEPAARTFRSTAEFVDFLDREQVDQLRGLTTAAAGAVAVDSTARNGLVLRCHDGLPRYTAADFSLDFAIEGMAARFFASLAGGGSRVAPAATAAAQPGSRASWEQAPLQRSAALELYGAAVAGDEARAGGALARLRDEAVRAGRTAGLDPDSDSALLYAAFCVAELVHAVLMARRLPAGAALRPDGERLRRELEPVARLLATAAGDCGPAPAGAPGAPGAPGALLIAQACELSGALLEDPDLSARGRRLLDMGLASRREEAARGRGGAESLGALAEAVVRLLSCDLLGLRREALREAIARGVDGLLQSLGENGQLAAVAAPEAAVEPSAAAAQGYEAYFRQEEVIYRNVRLALLLYGLSAGEGTAIEAALQVDYFVSHRDVESMPDTHALLGTLLP